MKVFGKLMNDKVKLVKADGEQIDNIKARVQPDMILIDDASLPIEEGDKIFRDLSNGLSESYLVLDRGFNERTLNIPAHYQIKVRKESAIETQRATTMQFHIANVYGSNIGTQGNATIENTFNFEVVDRLIEENGGEDKEDLRKMISEIKELFEDSEKIKKGSLSKFSELMQKHSWITGAVSKMGLDFLIGSLK
ncbi:hypothetical protein NLX71_26050 [Paenibacillus sp. MZ04-78.2]|uniref:hypothetical protein n=1 Tax=Paenibacillus sp. MZ04-78.2 TaxID=2962034 RepID=UPI0020B68A48|nr:hypothetical protein [Paenibacillus sp. MZ04-78.2]MCP3776705.1 hypothetical protein [Paenibacillus sp. MZ04-78.2]